MALKVSSGLRNALLDTGSLKAVMDGGKVQLYSGTAPVTADDAIGSAGTNNLLCEITLNGSGTGINFDTTAVAGVLSKAPGETWNGTNVASGTASFYRHVAIGDDGTLSSTQARLQGTVGTAAKEMNLTNVGLSASAEQNLDHYSVALPTF